jgi:hypothetical protein
MRKKLFDYEEEVYERREVATVRWDEGLAYDSEYAIDEWKNSEQGQWVFEHCKEITLTEPVKFPRLNVNLRYHYGTRITAYVKPADWTFYLLKWK